MGKRAGLNQAVAVAVREADEGVDLERGDAQLLAIRQSSLALSDGDLA